MSVHQRKNWITDYDDIEIDANSIYVICNFLLVFNALSEFVVCKSCSGAVKFGRAAGPGIGFKLIIDCSCGKRQIPFSPMSHKTYEINRRLLFAFRVLGCGLQSVKTFCSLLDIQNSFSTSLYYNFLDNLHAASKTVFEIIQKKTVSEEIEANSATGNEPTQLVYFWRWVLEKARIFVGVRSRLAYRQVHGQNCGRDCKVIVLPSLPQTDI